MFLIEEGFQANTVFMIAAQQLAHINSVFIMVQHIGFLHLIVCVCVCMCFN